ncbi:hypothetical protein D9615_009787 [Tricholomella constricta]|uniref:F-box domain-containing protein n=1 Tax=Tricholomella constricta TaxID=117010 RepID=A0A8H5GU29_9AGAR|nr:hypothetical protein D9615_009787 [Tricholomella constricta]
MAATETFDHIDVSALFSDASVREAACTQVSQELDTSDARKQALKRHHNSLSPISQLPVELFIEIFQYHMDNQSSLKKKIIITHVCSSWRQIALAYPSFWNDLPDDCVAWAFEMLKRSEMAPLTVSLPLLDMTYFNRTEDTPSGSDLTKAVLEQLSRIRQLSVIQYSYFLHDAMGKALSYLAGPAPLLETLTIHAQDLKLSAWMLPKDFQAPRLIHLELDGCSLDWTLSPLPYSLRTLNVDLPELILDDFMSALSQMPSLEDLSIRAFPDRTVTPLGCIVTLLRLTSLSVESDLLSCTKLFAGLTYPISTCVKVRCYIFDSPIITGIRSLAQILGNNIGTIKHLSISGRGLHHLEASTHCPSPLRSNLRQPSRPDLHFELASAIDVPSEVTIMSEFLTFLSLQNLEELWLFKNGFDRDTLIGHFGHLKLLRTLVSKSEPAILAALSSGISLELSAEMPPTQPGTLKFRGLRRLHLINSNFSGSYNFGEILTHCLEKRRERGSPLHRLYVREHGYSITLLQKSKLERVVGQFIWRTTELMSDGHEDLSSDSESELTDVEEDLQWRDASVSDDDVVLEMDALNLEH